jgi:hypothetical protein
MVAACSKVMPGGFLASTLRRRRAREGAVAERGQIAEHLVPRPELGASADSLRLPCRVGQAPVRGRRSGCPSG